MHLVSKLIEDITEKIVSRTKGSDGYYTHYTPYCTVKVSGGEFFHIRVIENFGDPDFVPRSINDKMYQGIRKAYNANQDGLYEVELEGVTLTQDGDPIGVATALLRQKNELTIDDRTNFHRLLEYVNKSFTSQPEKTASLFFPPF